MPGLREYLNCSIRILCCPILIVFFFLPVAPAQADLVHVTDVRYWSYPDYTRIVVSLTGKSEFIKNRLTNPDRLYFDINNSVADKEIKTGLSIGNGMLKSVRVAQFNKDTVRIVLDLDKIKDFKTINLEDPDRIIIDVYGDAVASVKDSKKRIVIDPGHGGHDPGAVGPKGLYEKDVVLDIALKLRKALSDNKEFEVFMTRDKDVFIPLEERTAIANSKKADLFVSIHANASPNKTAKGVETYFLNWTDDDGAMKVAARENRISLKKMKKAQADMDILDIIKGDLNRDVKRDESLRLAHSIQKTMILDLNKDYQNIVDNGVKWALFYVLFGAQMPSVLVEVSFISNPLEERRLSKSAYRGDLAKSIATGISKYMSAPSEAQTASASR